MQCTCMWYSVCSECMYCFTVIILNGNMLTLQKGFSEDVTLDQLQTFFDTFGKVS